MNKWNDYFKIVQVDNSEDPGRASATMWMLDESYYKYELHDPQGNVVATYKDMKYAKKQAKYKFKRIMAKLEKILLA